MMSYSKAIGIGVVSGLSIAGFWALEETSPLIAKGLVLVFGAWFIAWIVKNKV